MRYKKHILIDNGATDWKIIVGNKASVSERYAADELQKYLFQISGVNIPIDSDVCNPVRHEVIIGENSHLSIIDDKIDLNGLGVEGFIIKMTGDYLIITGGKLRGTLYGVYTFLEKYLGCRWFSHKVSSIPSKKIIELPDILDMQTPVFDYRECNYYEAFDGDWSARNKLNGHFHKLEEKHGKKIKYSHFVHTFNELVPVEEYFGTHPEYFSEIDGKRINEKTQLCLTNKDVFDISLTRVRQWIEEDREATIFSVSQNDCYNPCQCGNCRKIDEMEESFSGTLLYFVNKIAEAVGKDYPDVYIDTLAYQHTRKPPKFIRPVNNVIIRLCSIECCFSHPMEICHAICSKKKETSREASFSEDLKQWSKICSNIYIWDYVTNFANYIMPFPNFHILKPNMQFFAGHNTKGIFEEGNYSDGGGGEFSELRAYVIAKLLWNPEEDVDIIIDDFLNGYFGRAAVHIRAYMDMMSGKVLNENIHMGIFDAPTAQFLSEEIMEKAEKLFNTAETLAENEEILNRIRIAWLPVEFVKIAVMPKEDSDRYLLVKEFYNEVKNAGIMYLKEYHTHVTLEEQIKELEIGWTGIS